MAHQQMMSNAELERAFGLRPYEISILRRLAAFPAPIKKQPEKMQSRVKNPVEKIQRWRDGIERLKAELAND